MRNLYKLKPEDHQIIDTIFKIVKDELISNTTFESTVFLHADKFKKSNKMIGDALVGKISKPMVETPLIAERGNTSILYISPTNSYMDFGIILIDYRKKHPLLTLTVTPSEEGYSYKSARFENNVWSNGISNEFTAESLSEFIDKIAESLNEDVKYFTDKY
jgi:hypothetical protein